MHLTLVLLLGVWISINGYPCKFNGVANFLLQKFATYIPKMSDKVESSELRKMSVEQLTQELEMFKREHQKMLQQKHSQSIEPEEVKMARKNITRCTQAIREKQLIALAEEYKGKKFIPKELRPRTSKALRNKLTSKQTNQKVRRARIRAAKYPQKIFAFVN